ncbi:MAG: ATP-binding protein [Saccharofermentanales bacterium]
MIRKVIKIDEGLCNGCGICASACLEGAIGIVDGKAKLLRDDYCDGLGNCLPACPTGAITFEEREAAAFDEAAVKMHMENETKNSKEESVLPCGCPSTQAKSFNRSDPSTTRGAGKAAFQHDDDADVEASNLSQWPVQIKLVPVKAPFFENANLLIAADCAAYAHPSFNRTFMKNKITVIGCPKLDDVDYTDKLANIIAGNSIKSISIVRMEVPCCSGIVAAAVEALRRSGKMIPWSVVTLATDGSIIE